MTQLKQKPKKKPAKKKATSKASPKKKLQIKPKVKKTDTATVGTDEQMDPSTIKAIENASNLPSTPEAQAPAEEVKMPTKPKVSIKPKIKV